MLQEDQHCFPESWPLLELMISDLPPFYFVVGSRHQTMQTRAFVSFSLQKGGEMTGQMVGRML